MGTGGSVQVCSQRLRETTVVFNGDILTDLDIAKVIETHQTNSAAATITLVPVDDPSRYGIVVTGDDGVSSVLLRNRSRTSLPN
jgi:NDP-sugar pyrophosphorylase family protein